AAPAAHSLPTRRSADRAVHPRARELDRLRRRLPERPAPVRHRPLRLLAHGRRHRGGSAVRLGNFSFSKLRQRDIAIIAIVLSLVAGAIWYFYVYRPTQDRITQLESDIARLDVEIRRGEDARRNLPDLRLAVAQLEEDRRV